MASVIRKGDFCTGHGAFPPRPSVEGSKTVYAEGIPVHRIGDKWAFHSAPDEPTHDGVLAQGSKTVYVEGKGIGHIGDRISCGSTAGTGSNTVFAG
jgi:uncharacterized Zn-binding protein involved in type VI secretion